MTDNTQPEALRLADELEIPIEGYPEATELERNAAAELRRLHTHCQELESQVIRDCMTHVQNPAEIEHVAGDVSKNGAESNMSTQQPAPAEVVYSTPEEMFDAILTPQPAPATQQAGEVSDAMVLAALRVQYPAAYGQYLRHPANGPKTSLRTESEIDTARRMIAAALSAAPQPSPTAQAADSVLEDAAQQPRLTVRLTAFPESNGKQNWTALLVRADKWDGLIGNCGGISLARGELWNRVAYAAECARFLIGERDTEPFILDYGDDIKTPEEWKGEVYGGRKPRDAARKQGANHD